ncbi:MAG: M24 family metallopeptidase [Rubripirellula sp.]
MKHAPAIARILAGYADKNASLFKRLGVPLGDPAAWIELDLKRVALVRDLEMDRVRQKGHADDVTCPAEHSPPAGLSADRETATAEAAAQMLRAAKVERVYADRSLPYIFAWHIEQAEIDVLYDDELGVLDRRAKTHQEIDALAAAQKVTEEVMRIMCEMIASCSAAADGSLQHEGATLTSERVRAMAGVEFMSRGFSMGHGAIVATAPHVADCHHAGDGPLFTGRPVIVDLFPRDESTRYWGDCTRTVVHGEISDTVKAMHAAVVEAKAASIAILTAGKTADEIHKASENVLLQHGYPSSRGEITDHPSIQHGTGHGIGLDLHEPILLDHEGEEVLEGEVFTVEPGLYGRKDGGVRIEDMLVVTSGEAKNLNALPDHLDWN